MSTIRYSAEYLKSLFGTALVKTDKSPRAKSTDFADPCNYNYIS